MAGSLGTYDDPYGKTRHNFSFMLEGQYAFGGKLLKGWSVKGAYGMDLGSITWTTISGISKLTVAKTGLLNL